MNMARCWFPLVALIGLVSGCPSAAPNGGGDSAADAPVQTFTATLDGSQETDDTSSTATGSGTFTLKNNNTELFFDITATGLTGLVQGVHFHNAPVGMDGGIVFDLTVFVFDTEDGVNILGTINPADFSHPDPISVLRSGEVYVNIHTTAFGAGEIRGQLIPD